MRSSNVLALIVLTYIKMKFVKKNIEITNTNNPASPQSRFSILRRMAPVGGLLFLAPWVGEYLIGNVPLNALMAIPFLVPLYGGGALLIREITRRRGQGWPTIFLLGIAYGLIEAGLVDQSLFNRSFGGNKFQEVTFVPILGISAYKAITFIIGHAVWSIAVPIAIVEMLTPDRRKIPWLGKKGLAVTCILYLLGCWIIFSDMLSKEGFMASSAQMIAVAGMTLILIMLALIIKDQKSPSIGVALPLPRPLNLGIGIFVIASLYSARSEDWVGVALAIIIISITALLIFHWSRQPEWSLMHEFALAAGALLTYAWLGFVLTSLVRPNDMTAWVGNASFAMIAILLLIVTGKAVERQLNATDS